MPGMADGDPQAMELAVPQQPDNVAQPVLAAVTAVELEARDAGREIQLIMGDQHFLRFDLPVAQRSGHRFAAEIHERGRLQQPDGLPGNLDLGGFAEQFAFQTESHAGLLRQRVNEPEPGIVPGSGVFGARISEPDDEA